MLETSRREEGVNAVHGLGCATRDPANESRKAYQVTFHYYATGHEKTPVARGLFRGCGSWTRTSDLQVMGLASCQLLYPATIWLWAEYSLSYHIGQGVKGYFGGSFPGHALAAGFALLCNVEPIFIAIHEIGHGSGPSLDIARW